jgi:hypothetical protein
VTEWLAGEKNEGVSVTVDNRSTREVTFNFENPFSALSHVRIRLKHT